MSFNKLADRSHELASGLAVVARANVEAATKESLLGALGKIASSIMGSLSANRSSSVHEVASKLSQLLASGSQARRDSGCFAVMSRARDVSEDCATLANIVAAAGSWGSKVVPMPTVESAVTTSIVHRAACGQAIEAWVVTESWAGAASAECQKVVATASALVHDAVGRIVGIRAAATNQLLAGPEPKAGGCLDGRSWSLAARVDQ